ncbi:MAG: site-specific integrase [bacterium]|nr:site-specific integrase [bacterium]
MARGPRRTTQREATTCRQLLSYLRANDRIPAAPSSLRSDSAMGRMEQAYERFLVRERGLTSATVKNYLPTVHTFLTERFGTETIQLERLVAQDANQFILRHTQRLSRSRAKLLVTALRSFLRFLYQRGDIPIDLASAVLPVMHWRLSGLPKSLAPEQVKSMLESCDRSTVIGRRDYVLFRKLIHRQLLRLLLNGKQQISHIAGSGEKVVDGGLAC